jgi:hypothetical protein
MSASKNAWYPAGATCSNQCGFLVDPPAVSKWSNTAAGAR